MSDWFYKQGDRILGPVSRAELDFLASTGRIAASTPVRSGGEESWQTYAPQRKKRNAAQPVSRRGTVTAAVAADDETVSAEPPAGSSTESESVAAPPLDADHRSRNAIIGAIAALLFLLLLIVLFWNRLPTGGGVGTDGQGIAGNSAGEDGGETTQHGEQDGGSADHGLSESDADSLATAATQASPDAVDETAKENATASGTGTDTADLATAADASIGSASVLSEPMPESEVGQPVAGTQVAGDPRSKFTIEAPGEARFFGLNASGRRFSFVVDRSGSMQGEPLQRAKEELMKCIRSLPQHVEVQVVFFDNSAEQAPGGFEKLGHRRVDELQRWVDRISTGGGTNVNSGIIAAFSDRKKPDAIFLLTDGGFDAGSPTFIRQLNKSHQAQINTVALVSDTGATLLKQIAKENHGDYRFVP